MQMLVQHSHIYKKKAIIMLVVAIIPTVANILYVLPIYSARIDFIPFSIVGSSLVLFFSYVTNSLFGPLPFAKQLIFESLTDGIILLDRNDSLIEYNSKSSQYIPSLPNFSIGTPIQKVFAQIPSYNELTKMTFYESGERAVLIHEREDDEKDLYFEVRILPIKQGTTKGTSILIRDVSESHVLQKIVEDSLQKLVGLNNLKTMVIEVMSHDLRSPLIAMRSLRKLMSNGTIAHNSVIWKRSGDELDSLIDRVDSLIFNLLALTTTFDTSKEINQQVVALESVLKEIEPAIMRYVRKKGIIFKKNVEEDVLILGSSEYLQAICRNILENAIKYSPKGGFVLLNVEIQKESILISIHDAGDGFAPHVLSAFEQDKWGVTTMGTQGEKGAGIGLYATKRFIQAQRGNICIKQNEPIGTIVEITIPRALKPITRSVI
jgi:signal transduction histidine kinase